MIDGRRVRTEAMGIYRLGTEPAQAQVWGSWPPTTTADAGQPAGEQMTVVRAIVVGNQAPARRRLRWELRLEPDLEVVGEAESGAQGVALAQELRPDIVIMDVEMPVMDGIEAAERLHALAPDCVIVLLTVKGRFESHERAMAAGARLLLERDNLPIFRASLHGLARFVRARNTSAWPESAAVDPAGI